MMPYRNLHSHFHLLRRNLRTVSRQVPATPGGTLKVRIPRRCNLSVSPCNPHTGTESWQHATVALDIENSGSQRAQVGEVVTDEVARRVTSELGLRVVVEKEVGAVIVEAAEMGRPLWLAEIFRGWGRWFRTLLGRSAGKDEGVQVSVKVEVPGNCNLDLEVAQGSVVLERIFEGDVRVVTESALIKLNRLKSSNVDIFSKSGSVAGALVQGLVNIRTKWGNITLQKAQGPSVQLFTERGEINIGAIYSDRGVLGSHRGCVTARAAHGSTYVRLKRGRVTMAGVEGLLDIEVDKGCVEAQVSSPRRVAVRSCRGDVKLGLPPQIQAKAYLEGATGIELSDALSFTEVDGQDESFIQGTLEGSRARTNAMNKLPGDDILHSYVVARAPTGRLAVNIQQWSDVVTKLQDAKWGQVRILPTDIATRKAGPFAETRGSVRLISSLINRYRSFSNSNDGKDSGKR